VPSDFEQYGGAALALQLGHRVSEDLISSPGWLKPDFCVLRLACFGDLDPADPNAWV